jgi:hypothetical protein
MTACSIPTPKGDLVCGAAALVAQAAINRLVEPSLEGLYSATKTRAASVGDSAARLIVLGYPDFFPDNLLGLILNNPVTSFHPNQAGQVQGYEAALAAITG